MKSKSWAPGHKYWGLTANEIKALWNSNGSAAANSGTNLHEQIEIFMNDDRFVFGYTQKELLEAHLKMNRCDSIERGIEWDFFLKFVEDHPHLKPYRTEWTIYDEDVKIAGSIDMVYENPDGTLSIYDWKRAKNITRINNFNKFASNPIICHFPDSNFWHYALQLNTYKAILESKYDKTVRDLYLVRLHPDAEEKNYELIELPDLSKDIYELFEERKRNL
jgi:ATP-dependent exoDNAse (exonuclease V) beta subunit